MRLLSTQPFVKRNVTRLFLTSCTILFFELMCIRWIPAYVRYVGYFSNFTLLSSFLGLGVLLGRRSWKFPPFAFMLIVGIDGGPNDARKKHRYVYASDAAFSTMPDSGK